MKLALKNYRIQSVLLAVVCLVVVQNPILALGTGTTCGDQLPVKATFKRMQTYRSFLLSASGKCAVDTEKMLNVSYVKPFNYSVTYTDTTIQTHDEKKGTHKSKGVQYSGECDPFQALQLLCTFDTSSLVYSGSLDSVKMFEGNIANRKFVLSVDRKKSLWREITFFDQKQRVCERVRFYHKSGGSLPYAIVAEKKLGKEVEKDSLFMVVEKRAK